AYIFFTIVAVITSYFISRFQLVEPTYIRFTNAVIFNIGWVVFFFLFIRHNPIQKLKFRFYKLPIATAIFIVLWGCQCYIGLSNAGNLTMFSNLVTEKSRNNHMIIDTRKTKIWDF